MREKRIEGISDIWDETNREGMRIVIELKRDAIADVVLNQLWRHSDLQSSFGANMLAINGGRPEQLNLKDMISSFTAFREEVVSRRTKHLLAKSRDRAHVLVGLAVAVANIDDMIRLIRGAPSPADAREQMMARAWPAKDIGPLVELIADPRHRLEADGTIRLSDEQARAILDLRLQRLTALGRDEIGDELKKLGEEIKEYLAILSSRVRIVDIIKKELTDIKAEFGTPRLTEIVEMEGEVEDEDLIQREDVVVTVSHRGYIKRVPLSTYRAQRRGGKGRAGMSTREEDVVTQIFIASTHTPVLFFSSRGMVYRMKVWRLPAATPQSIGKALVNLLPLAEGETITSILPLPEDEKTWGQLELMFATRAGNVRRNSLADFENINRNGKIAMKLDEGDRIVRVAIASPDDDVLLTTAQGQCIRFQIKEEVRLFKGRASDGVRGIRLEEGDEVISMAILRHVEATPGERAVYMKQALAMRRAQGAEGVDAASEPEVDAEAEAVEADVEPHARPLCRARRARAVRAHGVRARLRQALLLLRLPHLGPRRQRHHRHDRQRAQRAGWWPPSRSRIRDQIMLVTDAGKLIRCPVDDVRIAGRSVQGVRIFKTDEAEKVVSVERIPEEGNGDAGEGGDGEGEGPEDA